MKLYPFQQEAVLTALQAAHDGDNILISSPTASGKSLCEIALVSEVERRLGMTCGMITSQREIVNGIVDKGQEMGVNLTNKIWTPTRFWNQLERHRAKMPQVLIVDECHHGLAVTWQRLINRKSYEGDKVRVVGFTATPMRGVEYEDPPWKALFHRFHEAITIIQAIKQNILANFYLLKDTIGLLGEQEVDTERKQNEVAADAIQTHMDLICDVLKSLDMDRPTVFITPTVAAATAVATFFKYRSNIPVEPLVGTTSENRRDKLLKLLARNKVWIAAVNIMTEGVDVPEICRVVNLRPSVSPIPYVQGLGRGLRLIYKNGVPDLSAKKWCEYVDFTNNLQRFRVKLRDIMGLSFKEANEYILVPDLNFTPEAGNRMTIYEDYINFRYSRAPLQALSAHWEDAQVTARVGSTTGNDWAVRLFLPGNKSDVFVLEKTSGLWKKKTASLQPKNFKVAFGSSREDILTLGSKMGRGFKQITDEDLTIGDLLLFSLLRQLSSESKELTDLEKESYQISRKFLKSLPSPAVLEERMVE